MSEKSKQIRIVPEFELINAINGDRVTLVYKRIMEKDAIKSIKTSLSGNWDCMTYPFDITRNSETCGTF
ncbi:MAG: hypothetical protein R2784_10460 [Saprospiraceae bacterium]